MNTISILAGAIIAAAPFIAGFTWMAYEDGLVTALKVSGTLLALLSGIGLWVFVIVFLFTGAPS